MNTAEICIRKGEYDRVRELLGEIKPDHLASELDFRLMRAKYNIHAEKSDIAKSDLEYIVAKGNKLHIVEVAKNLLSELDQ